MSLLVVLVFSALLIAAVDADLPDSQTPAGSELVALGASLIPLDEALPRLDVMLNGNVEEQLQALAAIRSRPYVVKDLPMFSRIVAIAATGEDYRRADAAFEKLKGSEDDAPTLEEAVLDLGARAEVRSVALLIAVANGSPEAVALAEALKKSGSPTERWIAAPSQRWIELHGTKDVPKPPPLIYCNRLIPFSTFLDSVSADLGTEGPERQGLAIESIERAFESAQLPSESRDALIVLLSQYSHANSDRASARSNLLAICRAAFLAGGPASKALLMRLSQSTDASVSEKARMALGDFDQFHSARK